MAERRDLLSCNKLLEKQDRGDKEEDDNKEHDDEEEEEEEELDKKPDSIDPKALQTKIEEIKFVQAVLNDLSLKIDQLSVEQIDLLLRDARDRLSICLDADRRSLREIEALFPATDDELNSALALQDVRSTWRQYYTYLSGQIQGPVGLNHLVQRANLVDFLQVYAKNDHPTLPQGRSSASIYNRCVYLSMVLQFFRMHPTFFDRRMQEHITESLFYVTEEAKIYEAKKKREAMEHKSNPIQKIELKDFSRDERSWLVLWLALEVDAIAQYLESQDHPMLTKEQAFGFQSL